MRLTLRSLVSRLVPLFFFGIKAIHFQLQSESKAKIEPCKNAIFGLEVGNGSLYSMKEVPTMKPSSQKLSLDPCQGQNSST